MTEILRNRQTIITIYSSRRLACGISSLATERLPDAWPYEAAFVGSDNELGAVVGIEFRHDTGQVRFHRGGRDEQLGTYLVIRETSRNQGEDLALAVGKSA